MKSKSGGGRRSAVSKKDYIKEQGSLSEPDLGALKEEFEFALNERASSVFTRARMNHETRYCIWPGQSEDGRKWSARGEDNEVFPWPGASDAQVRLTDLYIRKQVAFLMVLWNRMRMAVRGMEVNDEKFATRMTSYLRWQLYTQMEEAAEENELLANTLLERGSALMGVWWLKQSQLGYEELDFEGVINQSQQRLQGGDTRFQDLPGMIRDPSYEGEAAELVGELLKGPLTPALSPSDGARGSYRGGSGDGGVSGDTRGAYAPQGLSQARLKRIVEDLRVGGYAKFPLARVLMNRPKVCAYVPNEDAFLSPDATGVEDGTMHIVEVMREAKLRGRGQDYGWDPAWVEEMIERQKGNVTFGGLLFNRRITRESNYLLPTRGDMGTRKSLLVVHSYRRLTDAEGVPGIYYTVWNPHLSERCAKHELLDYEHGKSPFVLVTTEKRSRRPDDARGYGEVAHTWQGQIKSEWDGRIDRSSVATLPPSHYPPGQQPDKWGPGVQVPTSNPDGYGFFQPPKYDPGSKEVEVSVRQFSDEYFGFATEDPAKAQDAQAMRQLLGDNWMRAQGKIGTQVLQLCQQFESDDIYFRVVGSAQGKAIHTTREEIQGKFDLVVGFRVEDLDPELVKEKMGLIGEVLQMDVNGIVDRNEILTVAFDIVDPNLGERVLKPAESASLAEVEDEQSVAVKLLAGIQVPVKPGQAYQLRLQTLQNLLRENQTAQQLLQNNPQVGEAVKQRVKDLKQQLDQQQNAVTGRGGPYFQPKLLGEGS